MGKRKILLICLVFLTLTACTRRSETPLRVVTRVDVVCDRGYQVWRRQYKSPEKMEMVLDYLRLQDSLGTVQTDPERLQGDTMQIEVWLSDGTSRIYYQKSQQYLSKQLHAWVAIDSQRAAQFSELLRRTPADQ